MPVTATQVPLRTAKMWAQRIKQSLKRQGHDIPLSASHKAMADAFSFKDWHHLEQTLGPSKATDDTSFHGMAAVTPTHWIDQLPSCQTLDLTKALQWWQQWWASLPTQEPTELHLAIEENQAHARVRANGKLQFLMKLSRPAFDCWTQAFELISDTPLLQKNPPENHLVHHLQKQYGHTLWEMHIQQLPAQPGNIDVVLQLVPRRLHSVQPISLLNLGFSSAQTALLQSELDGMVVAGGSGSNTRVSLRELARLHQHGRTAVAMVAVERNSWEQKIVPVITVSPFQVFSPAAHPDSFPALMALARGNVLIHEELRTSKEFLTWQQSLHQAGFTGTTLHASSAIGILQRLQDFLPASAFDALVNQAPRLALVHQQMLPVLCPHCRTSTPHHPVHPQMHAWLNASFAPPASSLRYRGLGCSRCHQGSVGWRVAAEVGVMTSERWQALKTLSWPAFEANWRRDIPSAFEQAGAMLARGDLDLHDLHDAMGLVSLMRPLPQ